MSRFAALTDTYGRPASQSQGGRSFGHLLPVGAAIGRKATYICQQLMLT
jgi:hypothetical protein